MSSIMLTHQIVINVKSALSWEQILTSECQTVVGLRALVGARFQVASINEVILVFQGKILPDMGTIRQYEIIDGAIVHMVKKKSHLLVKSVNPSSVEPNALMSDPASLMELKLDRRLSSIIIPRLQTILSDPEYIRQTILTDPRMKRTLNEYPHIRHIVNSDSNLRELSTLFFNRAKLEEVKRVRDLSLMRVETIPGGTDMLYRLTNVLNEPYDELELRGSQSGTPTTYFNPQRGRENCLPLPNPWIKSTLPNVAIPQQHPLYNRKIPQLNANSSAHEKKCCDASQWLRLKIQQSILMSLRRGHFSSIGHVASASAGQCAVHKATQIVTNTQDIATQTELLTITGEVSDGSPKCAMCHREQPSAENGLNRAECDNCAEASPEIRYQAQMEQLANLGFNNREENLRALMDSLGDVNAAVKRLKTSN